VRAFDFFDNPLTFVLDSDRKVLLIYIWYEG